MSRSRALDATERGRRGNQAVELWADTLGLELTRAAGYNVYAAGAFFGRLQMQDGTTSAAARLWDRYRLTHPFHEDRIDHLRRWLRPPD